MAEQGHPADVAQGRSALSSAMPRAWSGPGRGGPWRQQLPLAANQPSVSEPGFPASEKALDLDGRSNRECDNHMRIQTGVKA